MTEKPAHGRDSNGSEVSLVMQYRNVYALSQVIVPLISLCEENLTLTLIPENQVLHPHVRINYASRKAISKIWCFLKGKDSEL